jgi:hypothetical protein
LQLMITIITTTCDMQKKIELGRRRGTNHRVLNF